MHSAEGDFLIKGLCQRKTKIQPDRAGSTRYMGRGCGISGRRNKLRVFIKCLKEKKQERYHQIPKQSTATHMLSVCKNTSPSLMVPIRCQGLSTKITHEV